MAEIVHQKIELANHVLLESYYLTLDRISQTTLIHNTAKEPGISQAYATASKFSIGLLMGAMLYERASASKA